jgi:hypothetical protein
MAEEKKEAPRETDPANENTRDPMRDILEIMRRWQNRKMSRNDRRERRTTRRA